MGTLRFPKDNTFSTSMIPHWCDNRKFALDGVGNVAGPRAHLWDLLWGSFCKLRMCTCSAILVLLQMCISGRVTGAGRATRTLRRGRPIGAPAALPLGVFLQVVNVHMLGKDGFASNV